jgi:hypothetical protein
MLKGWKMNLKFWQTKKEVKKSNDPLNWTNYEREDIEGRVIGLYNSRIPSDEILTNGQADLENAIENAKSIAWKTFGLAAEFYNLGCNIKSVSVEKVKLSEMSSKINLPVNRPSKYILIGDIIVGVDDFNKYDYICKSKELINYGLKIKHVNFNISAGKTVLSAEHEKLSDLLNKKININETYTFDSFSQGNSQIDGFWLTTKLLAENSCIDTLLMRNSEQIKHWGRNGAYVDFTDLFEKRYKVKK